MLIIPRHSVFVKFIDVPSLEEAEIEKMAEFQVVKEIPHPKEDLVISYRRLSSYREGFSSLMLTVATKNMIKDRIRETGQVDAIRVHSELLYLFLLKEDVVSRDKVSFIIHIGKDDSEIMIIDNARPIFSRGFKDNKVLLEEIGRSILAYKRDRHAPEIENIVVVYPSGVNTEDTKNYIKGHFAIPVTFQEYSSDFTSADLGPQIDLMPKEISYKKTKLEKRHEFIITYSLTGAFIILFFASLYLKMYEKNKVISALSLKREEVESRIQGLDGFLKKTETIKNHTEQGKFIIDVLEDFNILVPADISISELDYDGKESIFCKGSSKDMNSIFNYVKKLENSKYFTKAEVKYATKKKTRGRDVIDFNISCQLER